jgi:hypothetical protein
MVRHSKLAYGRCQTLVLLGALFVASARAELSLTPTISQYESDGVKTKVLAFPDGADGAKTVTYQAPRGWDYSGSAAQLTLRPPNKSQVEATITRIPLSEPGRFDDASLRKLVSEAIALVPKGSENVSVVSQEKNPLLIEGKETFLITLGYTLFGQKFGRSILFLNREKEQIRSQLTCQEGDFKELHRVFLASQYTWQRL